MKINYDYLFERVLNNIYLFYLFNYSDATKTKKNFFSLSSMHSLKISRFLNVGVTVQLKIAMMLLILHNRD